MLVAEYPCGSKPNSLRNTGCKERIWQSDKEKYYETVVALMSDQKEGDLRLDQLKIMTSKESKTENPQYHILSWPEKQACQITNFPHPYSQLAPLQREMIRYHRKDGVQLTATLYLPPGYDPSKDGPLPCLVWCDPDEFATVQVRGSPNKFAGIRPTSPLLWLARRHGLPLPLVCLYSLWVSFTCHHDSPSNCIHACMACREHDGPTFHSSFTCRFAILSGPALPMLTKGLEGDEKANDR
jgi:hypothetical protein